MAVTKQKRSYMNRPIGVTRFETGEDEMWESVANTASQLNQIALKEGAKQAEQSGLDAAMAVEQSEIIAFDAESGKPKALNPKMFSGGIIARDAYKRVVEKRFGASIESELKSKAAELQLKYKFQPELFREEMSRYVADMHENAQGKWKETVKVGGVAITRATELNIQANAIEKNNQELALNIQEQANNFLNKEFYNNFINFNKQQALDNVNTQAEELINTMEDAEASGIIPVGSAEEFENNYLTTYGVYEAQEMLRNNTIIPLIGGDEQRNALSIALTTGDYNSLNNPKNQDAKKILTDLIAITGGDKNILSSIGTNIGKNIETLNVQSQAKQAAEVVSTVYDFEAKQISTINNIEFEFADKTIDLSKNGKIETNLRQLDREANLLISQNRLNKDANIQTKLKIIEANKETIKNSIAKQSIFELIATEVSGEEDDLNILDIKVLLQGDMGKVNNLTPQGQNIVNFINRNKISIAGFAGIFSDKTGQYSQAAIKEKLNQTKAAFAEEEQFKKSLSLNTYEENEKNYNTLIDKLNDPKGNYSKVEFDRINALKRRLTLIISQEALGQIGFKNSNETLNTLAFLEGNDNALNNMPKVKEILEDIQSRGILPAELKPTITSINSRLKQSETAESARLKFIENKNTIISGSSTNSTVDKRTAQSIFIDPYLPLKSSEPFAIDIQDTSAKFTLAENLSNPNLMQDNPRLFAGLVASMELNVIPTEVETFFNNVSRGVANIEPEQAAGVTALVNTLMNRVHPDSSQSHDLLDDVLNAETYSIFKTAIGITKTEGNEKALEFILNANKINTKDFNARFDVFLDTYEYSNVKSFLKDINDDLGKDGQAIEDFIPYVKHLYLSGMDITDIKDKIKNRYKEAYKDTEGLVIDAGNQNVNRSRNSIASTYGKIPGLEQKFIGHVQQELSKISPHLIFEKDATFVSRIANLSDLALAGVAITAQTFINQSIAEKLDVKKIALNFYNEQIAKGKAKRVVLVPIPSSDQLVIHAAYVRREDGGLEPVRTADGDHLAFSNRDDYLINYLNNKTNTESNYTLEQLEDSIRYRENLPAMERDEEIMLKAYPKLFMPAGS